jgi:fatty acid-binding protein DegV
VIVNVVEGRLRLVGAARSFKSGLRGVLNLVERMGPLEHLAVVHTRNQEVAKKVADQLAERIRFPRARIWVQETGAVLSTHAGPGGHRRPGRADGRTSVTFVYSCDS